MAKPDAPRSSTGSYYESSRDDAAYDETDPATRRDSDSSAYVYELPWRKANRTRREATRLASLDGLDRGVAVTVGTGGGGHRKRLFLRRADALEAAKDTGKFTGWVAIFAVAMCLFTGALVAVGIFVLGNNLSTASTLFAYMAVK